MSNTKKYNITHLLDGKIEVEIDGKIETLNLSRIEIPIIQRDYAQGRVSSKFIRQRFLDSIFEALINDNTLEMDFVYGSIKEVNDGNNKCNVFLPLDGQQRLTTLFLLYWFLANTEELEDEQLIKERKRLSRFSYSTRSTARSFCEKLSFIGYKGDVRKSITSAYWFHKSYEKDPTVMGMITTLEDIQNKHKECNLKVFERLDKLCFYILPLDGFDLTDELYIKMNARGKALTDFENFKADIINWMKSNKNFEKKLFSKKVQFKKVLMPWYLSIASKFDNSWADIFWAKAKKNKKEEDKIVDTYFLRFLKRFFLNQFIASSTKNAKDIESSKQFQLLYSAGNEENNKYQSFDDYKEFVTPNTFMRLEKILDAFNENQDIISEVIKPAWNKEDDWFLYDAKITQIQRILFFAITKYLEKNTFDEEKFKEWIRVVWNIIIDPDIRSIASMITALKTINEIAENSEDIYSSFSGGVFDNLIEKTTNIHKLQLIEEKKKINLFKIEGWKNQILEAETHPLFQGNIGFLLIADDNLKLFSKRFNQASLLFTKNGTNKDYLKKHSVLRYCISQFETWEDVETFSYSEEYRNWQLSLRRNMSIIKSISELCSLEKEEIEGKIVSALNMQSRVTGWDEKRLQLVHYNLYKYNELVECTQKKGISKIRWRNDLYYFVRPGAWYDKVLIDGYRNVVINKFCEIAKIDNKDKKCGLSDFVFGEKIEFQFKNDNNVWKIIFKSNNHIDIQKFSEQEEWECIYKDKKPVINAKNEKEAKELAQELWENCNL